MPVNSDHICFPITQKNLHLRTVYSHTLAPVYSLLTTCKKKFNEIMSMNVTPSTGTNLLDVTIDTDLNMIDASGNIVEDTDSITAEKYYADKGIDITSEDFNSADNNSGSIDDSSDDGSYDDGSYDDGSYDDGSYDDGSYDDGSYDDGSYDDGSYDDSEE